MLGPRFGCVLATTHKKVRTSALSVTLNGRCSRRSISLCKPVVLTGLICGVVFVLLPDFSHRRVSTETGLHFTSRHFPSACHSASVLVSFSHHCSSFFLCCAPSGTPLHILLLCVNKCHYGSDINTVFSVNTSHCSA